MSYKFGLLLSMIYVVLFSMFGLDLIVLQYGYGNLDAASIAISYQISQRGSVDDTFKQSIESRYNVTFECLSNCTPIFGDIVEYKISKTVNTLIIHGKQTTISLYRSAVVGYYD